MSEVDTGEQATQTDEQVVAEAVAGAPTEATGEETTETPSWMFAEGVEGQGDAPDWFKADKYQTVSEQAKAYKDLESRFGSFTGAPDEYKVALSEELAERGVTFADDDPMVEEAIKFAKESNMDQGGFDKMINLYGMVKASEEESLKQFKADELKSLGDNAQGRIDNLVKWGQANFPEDLFQGFQDMAVSATAVQAMEKLVSMTRSAPISPEGADTAVSMDAEELREMQFAKDEHGNRKIQTDPEYKARYRKLMERVHGSEEFRQIIGK